MKYILLIFAFLLINACETTAPERTGPVEVRYAGETMGTTYHVIYFDTTGRDFQSSMDSLLLAINAEVSTYEPESFISKWNQSTQGIEINSPLAQTHPHFAVNLDNAFATYQKTDGYFDATIMPLVNYWGFGYTQKRLATAADSLKVDSLVQMVGMSDKVEYREGAHLRKTNPAVQLDFSANAKGYAVDELGRLLEARGVGNYYVEIGGEVRARGEKPGGVLWSIGISTPRENAPVTDVQEIVELDNRSVATSGNYRIFYEVEGQKLSHIINPKTGYPERRNLLSASVFAKDCITADAYATAFMVMGTEAAFAFASQQPDIEAYLIFADENDELKFMYTDGLKGVFRG